MYSLKTIVFNILRLQHPPKCSVKVGRYTTSIPYIISSSPSDRVEIGNYCSIGHGTVIITNPGGHYPPKGYENYRVTTYPLAVVKKHGWLPSYALPEKRTFVIIGNDVTIGANSIILPGVTIGDGAIIGAGAVVASNVEPYAIAAGVPAKLIKHRYTADKIAKLLTIAWWNWSEEKIYQNMDYFYGDVDVFIEKFYKDGDTNH